MRSGRLTRTVLLLLSVWFAATPAAAGQRHAKEIEEFRSWAASRLTRDRIPGISIGFVKGEFTWAEGFGHADLENRVPAHAASSYRLASVTKPMTAIGVLKLVQQGKLHLDAEVQRYVPYYPRKRWPITVRQVLGHLGGIPHYINYDEEGHFKEHKSTEEAVAVFADFGMFAEPGTRYHYSSYGYNLLGAVIEGASGRSYGEFMREVLWEPLGMKATRMEDSEAIIPHRVRGYVRDSGGKLRNSEYVDISSRFASGGVRSTVVDLLAFGRALNEGRVLPPELMELALTPMVTREGTLTGYGMGWNVSYGNGYLVAAHTGGQAETRTYFAWFPDLDFVVAVAMNFEGGQPRPYATRLFELIHGEPWVPRVYSGDRAHRVVHSAMRQAWNGGLSRIEHFGRPLTSDPHELREAFRFFNETVSVEALEAAFPPVRQSIRAALHPKGGERIRKVGSYMAARLLEQADAEAATRLHSGEAIPFFHDYVRLYREDSTGIPEEYRLSEELEKLVDRWSSDWARTWTPQVHGVDLSDPSMFDATLARVEKLFAGASVYPNYWGSMENRIGELGRSGRLDEALQVAEAGRRLYPQLGGPHFHAGVLYLVRGDEDGAERLILQAAERAPSAADAGFLNGWAHRLRSAGSADAGLGLLRIAVKMNPEDANLHDSLGGFLLSRGDVRGAIRHYRKALELDPDFRNARRVLERLTAPVAD